MSDAVPISDLSNIPPVNEAPTISMGSGSCTLPAYDSLPMCPMVGMMAPQTQTPGDVDHHRLDVGDISEMSKKGGEGVCPGIVREALNANMTRANEERAGDGAEHIE
jgi:hypothetical protein